MTKYKRFMAAVRHLQDYRKQNTRPIVKTSMNAKRQARSDDGVEFDLHSALLALSPRLRRFAMALTSSTVDADDLIQAAHDRAISGRARFSTDVQILAWMYRVMQNLSIDENSSLQAGRWGGMDATREVAGDDGETNAGTDITLANVRRALAHLPQQQRTALILICVDGMSYKEVAEILDIPLGVMTSRIARAREALHTQIARESRTNVRDLVIPMVHARAGSKPGEH
jgi:RNA polymerase sigma-70 factor (ECF subfamily)